MESKEEKQLKKSLINFNPQTRHVRGDTDLLIVQTTIQSASTANTVLVGDDTDLLILLCYHAPIDSSHEIYFWIEVNAGTSNSHSRF